MSEQTIRIPADDGRFGKYDEQSELVLRNLNAAGVLLIVFGGPHGPGFSVSTRDLGLIADVPKVLREVANNIEKQIR